MFGMPRWTSLDDVLNLHREVDRLFNQAWSEMPLRNAVSASPTIPFNVRATDDGWRVTTAGEASINACRISSVPSRDPSSTTMSSQSVKVCALTDASVAARYRSALYAGMQMEIRGVVMYQTILTIYSVQVIRPLVIRVVEPSIEGRMPRDPRIHSIPNRLQPQSRDSLDQLGVGQSGLHRRLGKIFVGRQDGIGIGFNEIDFVLRVQPQVNPRVSIDRQ